MFRPGSSWSSRTGSRKRLNCSTRKDLTCMAILLVAQQAGQDQQGVLRGLAVRALAHVLQLVEGGAQVAVGLQGVQIVLRGRKPQGVAPAIPGAAARLLAAQQRFQA